MKKEIEQKEKTRNSLIEHCHAYPRLQITDIFKFIFQSSFGCEHLVSDEERAINYIKSEIASVSDTTPCVEQLDGEYSRVHLSYLKGGLTPETLGKLFFLSAKTESDGKEKLLDKLEAARELIKEGSLPFSIEDFEHELSGWSSLGYPAIHHSQIFRSAYNPAYRVISERYVRYLPLFSDIDRLLNSGNVVLAIEGGSASGKSTLADILSDVYDCNIFHMDDFFLRPEQRTVQRCAEIGGNVDRERFEEEILKPLKENREICYRPFNCSTNELGEPIYVAPKALTVIDGVYSMHPSLSEYYNCSVYLDISPQIQKERILKRNSGAFAERFFNEWIPLENIYFSQMNVKERCSLILEN